MIAETYKGYGIKVVYDEDPIHPRDYADNLGTIVSIVRNVSGDINVSISSGAVNILFLKDRELDQEIVDRMTFDGGVFSLTVRDAFISLPLYFLDHSGVAVSTSPFGDQWDSGFMGWILVSKTKIRDEYGDLSDSTIQKVKSILEAEVSQYDSYLRGDVYGFEVSEDGYVVESCYGFYDENDCLSEAKANVDSIVSRRESEEYKRLCSLPVGCDF